MERANFTRTFIKEEKEWHQLFGEEATKWFKKNCYWIAYKYSRGAIDYAWSIAQKTNDHDFTHFINNAKKL